MSKAKKKIAVIGKGKTGSHVVTQLEKLQRPHSVFDSTTDFQAIDWNAYCGGIVFIPASALEKNLNALVQSKRPMIIGTTGYTFPTDLQTKLMALKIGWIHGRNFALGMQLIHSIIQALGNSASLLPELKASIHEIHHTKKLDIPSGTALAWKEWFGDKKMAITSERVGDVVGDHQLTLSTPFEKITIRHQALDRSIFAQGAIWALDFLLQYGETKQLHGLFPFEQIVAMASEKQKELV